MTDLGKLKDCLANLEEDAVYEILTELMNTNPEQGAAALEVCQEALTEVGKRYESGEYFVGDLLFSSDIMRNATDILKPALSSAGSKQLGKMILCTVKDDIHDIGKNIVKGVMDAAGFEVIDLGIDVPPAAIIEAVKTNDVNIVALSGVLTLALKSMKDVVEAFTAAGIRNKVKIIIGGNPVTANACEVIGADDWANSPHKGADICRAWATA